MEIQDVPLILNWPVDSLTKYSLVERTSYSVHRKLLTVKEDSANKLIGVVILGKDLYQSLNDSRLLTITSLTD